MRHTTLATKATATDLGEFVAIAAAYSVDRANERIVPGAFSKTIDRWRESEKMVPFHWNHSGEAKDIIGYVDPEQMTEIPGEGLRVAGKIDLERSDVAREAWRSMKANTVSLSFGYMVIAGADAEDGVYELREIDLFEVSAVPAPANPDTKFTSLKSVQADDEEPQAKDIEDETDKAPAASRKASDDEADKYELERLRALASQ